MSHFTYKSPNEIDHSSLCQGDVLCITEDIKKILAEVHPYFLNDNYKYFIVLTQSCDLVIRDGKKCKSQYITLAAVHSFEDYLCKVLEKEKECTKINNFRFVNSKQKTRYLQMLERLYNNTESDYFFLYRDSENDFKETMVAYLKVSIALKSEMHYNACLNAKCLELSDEFKAKLGWLVGNIYSRVGTTDWSSIMTEKEKQQMIEDEASEYFVFAEKEKIKMLTKEVEREDIEYENINEIIKHMESYEIKTTYDRVMETIDKILENNLPQKNVESAKKNIHNNQALKLLITNNSV